MKHSKLFLRLLLHLMIVLVSCTSIDSSCLLPEPFKKAPLRGMVYHREGLPCQGLRMSISGKETITDFNGRFMINVLPTGEHTLVLSGNGYETMETQFVFTDRKQVFHTVVRRTGDRKAEAERALLAGDTDSAEKLLFPVQILWMQTWLLAKTDQKEQSLEFLENLLFLTHFALLSLFVFEISTSW